MLSCVWDTTGGHAEEMCTNMHVRKYLTEQNCQLLTASVWKKYSEYSRQVVINCHFQMSTGNTNGGYLRELYDRKEIAIIRRIECP